MKTKEMSSTLQAFAQLANADRSEELRKLAGIFSGGKDETVAARVKRIVKHRKSSPEPEGHPLTLRESLAVIAAGFSASGGKQASDFAAMLSLFEGHTSTSVDVFLTRLTTALAAPQVATSARNKPKQAPDQRLVRELADELARAVLDSDVFSKVVERLRDNKVVSTPTLGAIANTFLSNNKNYSGRKPAIDDILKRQKQDARAQARGRALDRIGV